ncbi:MAG: hypothetical protein LBJ14_02500 [Desulfarculales bacterium]|jgi:hypothetical protein|nr:hypothetical protein [Desulfarculales bacterium]
MQTSLAATAPLLQAAVISQLALPSQSVLRAYLQSRLKAEANNESSPDPGFTKAGRLAMWLFSRQDKQVNSYPLLYTSLALAHPN